MPRLALITIALIVLSSILPDSLGSITEPLDGLLALAVLFTIIYYCLRVMRWFASRLLWRVRRRLVITYLLVGITPIMLLTMFGVLAAFTGSSQAMARILAVQVRAIEEQALVAARSLAETIATLPPEADSTKIAAELDRRASMLRPTLPEMVAVAWVGEAGVDGIGHDGEPTCASHPPGLSAAGRGSQPLPAWLLGRAEWKGLSHERQKSEGEERQRIVSAVRAIARRSSGHRASAVAVSVPLTEAWAQAVTSVSGIRVKKWDAEVTARSEGIEIRVDPQRGGGSTNGDADFPVAYPLVLESTEWATGQERPTSDYVFAWGWREATDQLFQVGKFGDVLRMGFLIIGGTFLALELLALIAAAWMTRAVTGTVHELHLATEHMRRGEFNHRARVKSRDQLGELAVAFNDMAEHIESLLEERVEREKLEREVEIAAQVQAQLFPRSVPLLRTVEVSAECRAARGVAGDYYDYVLVAPGLMVFGLGDVAGKGLSASLVMSNLQASFRAQTTLMASDPGSYHTVRGAGGVDPGFSLAGFEIEHGVDGTAARMTRSINQQLCLSTEAGRFATLFLAIYDDGTGELRYTNAGHNAGLLISEDGTVERLSCGGTMAGAFEWAEYEEGKVTLGASSLLLLYSDGFTEARGADGEEYGEERLVQFAQQNKHRNAAEIKKSLFDEIDRWSAGRERGDDQTLLILKARRAEPSQKT